MLDEVETFKCMSLDGSDVRYAARGCVLECCESDAGTLKETAEEEGMLNGAERVS